MCLDCSLAETRFSQPFPDTIIELEPESLFIAYVSYSIGVLYKEHEDYMG